MSKAKSPAALTEALADIMLSGDLDRIENEWPRAAYGVTLEARRIVARASKKRGPAWTARRLKIGRATCYNWLAGKPIDPIYAYWTVMMLGHEFPPMTRKRKKASKPSQESAA